MSNKKKTVGAPKRADSFLSLRDPQVLRSGLHPVYVYNIRLKPAMVKRLSR